MTIVAESHFLPCLEYFVAINDATELILNNGNPYLKQGLRNRCFVLGPHKVERLVVPVSVDSKDAKIGKVRIAYHEPWQRTLWRTIENCYRKAPFFEYYEPYFHSVLRESSYEFLTELNTATLSVCLKLLNKNLPIRQAEDLIEPDFRLTYKKFGEFGQKYRNYAYQQNFGNDFVPNLSVLDLLFCKGPESLSVLDKSKAI